MKFFMALQALSPDPFSSFRVRGITHSVYARRWGGDAFDARPKPRHS